MSTIPYLGFPAPLLGMTPVRLPVVSDDGDALALIKPAGILVRKDNWYPRLPVLVEAIRYQAAQGKPEFKRMRIPEEGLWPVWDLDPECHGPVLFARNRDTAEHMRSEVGAENWRFTFLLLVDREAAPESALCDLPLARHEQRPRMLISHSTGKRARTEFRDLGAIGRRRLVSATAPFLRRHQILLHALELNMPVLGDGIYAGKPLPMLSAIKRTYRPSRNREEKPLYDGPAYFLHKVTPGAGQLIEGREPPRWPGLVRQLAKN
jgi:23S rRNA pseudouridine1911/1915/1917 synthase